MIGGKVLIATVSMPSAATEYSYTVPAGVKKLLFKLRDNANDLLFAYVTGNIGAGTYLTIPGGSSKSIEEIKGTGLTLYFQCSAANQTVEIETWK